MAEPGTSVQSEAPAGASSNSACSPHHRLRAVQPAARHSAPSTRCEGSRFSRARLLASPSRRSACCSICSSGRHPITARSPSCSLVEPRTAGSLCSASASSRRCSTGPQLAALTRCVRMYGRALATAFVLRALWAHASPSSPSARILDKTFHLGLPLRYLFDLSICVLTYVMLGSGLNIVVGLAGLLDLGYVAFYAVGAYTFALLATHFGLGFWICLPFAGPRRRCGASSSAFPCSGSEATISPSSRSPSARSCASSCSIGPR